MSNTLFANYRKMVEQAWMPIFVKDELDTEMLLEGCRLAGLQVVEYTLRREDAAEVIPTLREKLPGVVLFVGSTIDDEKVVNQMKGKFPQLMTISELAPYVDGYISMLPYFDEKIQCYPSVRSRCFYGRRSTAADQQRCLLYQSPWTGLFLQ